MSKCKERSQMPPLSQLFEHYQTLALGSLVVCSVVVTSDPVLRVDVALVCRYRQR